MFNKLLIDCDCWPTPHTTSERETQTQLVEARRGGAIVWVDGHAVFHSYPCLSYSFEAFLCCNIHPRSTRLPDSSYPFDSFDAFDSIDPFDTLLFCDIPPRSTRLPDYGGSAAGSGRKSSTETKNNRATVVGINWLLVWVRSIRHPLERKQNNDRWWCQLEPVHLQLRGKELVVDLGIW